MFMVFEQPHKKKEKQGQGCKKRGARFSYSVSLKLFDFFKKLLYNYYRNEKNNSFISH